MNDNSSSLQPLTLVLFFILSCLLGFLLADLSTTLLLGAEAEQIFGATADELGVSARQRLRWMQNLSQIFIMGLPSLLVAYLAYRNKWFQKLGLASQISWPGFGWSLLFMVAALPLVGYLQYINLQVNLPSWANNQEASTNNLIEAILTYEQPTEVFMIFLTIAIVPAFCEELLLRGLVQGRILPLFLRSPHAQIWLAAFFFSAMHGELGGLLPRWALGAVLGYAYFWSKSLWVPILLHFLFNGLQALIMLYSGEFTPDTEIVEPPNLLIVLIGLAICSWIFFNQQQKDRHPSV